MTVHAGVSLPGPFFIAFPVLPIVGGLFGLILLPAYLMFYMVVGMLWLMGALLYGIVWLAAKAIGISLNIGLEARDARAMRIEASRTPDEQAFLDEIMNR
ncbi:MAG: hypothetical protein MUP76_09810 [Acidimicrobiia bacterium]|nr:hypothetical protein [Acidimicrobiia bacterium]